MTTVKDVAPHLPEFLASVRAQTRRPDEVIVVDGGSSDGTFDILEREDGITVVREPGANISRGRNVAIAAAAHDVIAVTDGDCVLAPDCLARLIEPIERGADAVAGFYRPFGDSFLQRCAAAVSLPEPEELKPGWLPSSRSIAFTRNAYDAAGGYPEWLDVGEDMYFNHRLLATGYTFELAPEAVVYWRVRPTLAATWRQYARYAEGDALAGMYPERHAIRFGTYAFAWYAWRSKKPSLLAATVIGGALYARTPIKRALKRIEADGEREAVFVAVPAMMAFIDAAKMWGYAKGLTRRLRGVG